MKDKTFQSGGEVLPEGETCVDCVWFWRCQWLMQREGTETKCDWYPSRFVHKPLLLKKDIERHAAK